MPPEDAAAVVRNPSGPEVWAGLLAGLLAGLAAGLAAEMRVVDGRVEISTLPKDAAAELDDTGVPWLPRLGGRAPLGTELEQVARTGRWNRSHYAGRSEARPADAP